MNSDKTSDQSIEIKNPEGFFYQKNTIQWILRIFYACCILLVLADFIVHRHVVTDIERVPTFYAIYGLVSCVILVLIAARMRKLVMRDENYYSEDQEVDKEADNELNQKGIDND